MDDLVRFPIPAEAPSLGCYKFFSHLRSWFPLFYLLLFPIRVQNPAAFNLSHDLAVVCEIVRIIKFTFTVLADVCCHYFFPSFLKDRLVQQWSSTLPEGRELIKGYDDQYYPPTPKPDPEPDGVLCGISIKIKGECLADIISRVPYKLLLNPGNSFRCLRD